MVSEYTVRSEDLDGVDLGRTHDRHKLDRDLAVADHHRNRHVIGGIRSHCRENIVAGIVGRAIDHDVKSALAALGHIKLGEVQLHREGPIRNGELILQSSRGPSFSLIKGRHRCVSDGGIGDIEVLSTVRRPNIATAVDQLPATAMYTDARERRASLGDRERQPGDGQSATESAGADVRTHRVRYGSVAAAASTSGNLRPTHVAGGAPTAPSRRK